MKMYHFNSCSYDNEYTIMTSSPEEALESLQKHLKNLVDDDSIYDFYSDEYNKWKSATIDKLPDNYVIDAYKINQVLETEVS